MQKICFKCGKINNRQSKFGSKECQLKGYENICKNCHKSFLGRHKAIYCSRKCLITAMKGNKFAEKPISESYFCIRCNTDKIYKEYRQVNKNLKKGAKPRGGWRDIEGKQRYSYCKLCEIQWSSEKYRLNPYRQIHYSAKKRALKKGVPFELTRDDLKEMYENMPSVCPVLGIKIEHSEIGLTKFQSNNSPSLDKIDPKKGYIKGNVMIISALANRIKTDASAKDIKKVYDFLVKMEKP